MIAVLVASPKHSLYRVYRDTRFSDNKKPLKTHASAIFPWKGLPKHEGAGLYFEVAGGWVWASFAHSEEFYPTLLATFRAMMPLVRFLNEPLTGKPDL